MNKRVVDAAEAEARRFLEKIDQMKRCDELANDSYSHCGMGSQYTAAVRRASMDLTRALADLRRG